MGEPTPGTGEEDPDMGELVKLRIFIAECPICDRGWRYEGIGRRPRNEAERLKLLQATRHAAKNLIDKHCAMHAEELAVAFEKGEM